MRMMTAVAGTMLFMVPVQAMAASAETCLTRDEAKGLALFIMPDAIAALRDKCRTALPGNAYLNSAGASERFRAESGRRWPLARKAFEKAGGGGGGGSALTDILGDDATREVLTGVIKAGIAKDVKPQSCAGVDRMLAALAPLPIENVDMLLDSFFLLGLGGKGDKTGGFRICPDPATGSAMPVASKGTKK